MSLNRRLILSATLVLAVFISLTAIALERAFVESSESSLRDTLTSQLYALMAAADVDDGKVMMPGADLDVLLGLPSSGRYAFITDDKGDIRWQSSSVLGARPPLPLTLPRGEKRFQQVTIDGRDYYLFAYGIDWGDDTESIALTFSIASDLQSFNRQIDEYRRTLWGWLLAMAVLLLASQAFVLRWGLSPLRDVETELKRIEAAEQEKIHGNYPSEIEVLTSNINNLLEHERQQKIRYRNALGDLAHSLKTPLAVLHSGINKVQSNDSDLQAQLNRMDSIVEYQLQRAATAGTAGIGNSVNVSVVCERLLESMSKVYADKAIVAEGHIDASLIFKGDEGDLMEVIGNLLDNAFKWAKQSVEVTAESIDDRLHLSISDDGPGISTAQTEELQKRGTRADEAVAGHGIGLSIVKNIVQAYNGKLMITECRSGGTTVTIIL